MRKARLFVAALLVSMAISACDLSLTFPRVDPGGDHDGEDGLTTASAR